MAEQRPVQMPAYSPDGVPFLPADAPGEVQLRRMFADAAAARGPVDVAPLKRFAIVGAYDAEIGGTAKDSRLWTHALTYLLRAGVPVDPDFETDIVNFRDNRDFLAERERYDAVLVAFILAYKSRGTHELEAGKIDLKNCGERWRGYLGTGLSRHHEEENWLKRMRDAGARLVMTFGSIAEVNSGFLFDRYARPGAPANYDVLIPTMNLRACWAGTVPQDDCGYESDCPVPGLSFALDRDFMAGAVSSLAPETTLGRRARTALATAPARGL